MDFKDLLITPIFLIILYAIAFWARPKFTNKLNKKYFIPALSVKFIGAIGVGIIYQFYYGNGTSKGSGDTFLYFHQSNLLHAAFIDSPRLWFKLMLAYGQYDQETLVYTTPMIWYKAPTEFIILKITSFFSILTFHTYSSIALCFAFISFTGMWQMYITFHKLYPSLHRRLAISVFFLPSVFFWGSGLLKDSLAIGFLGWAFYGFYKLFIEKKQIFQTGVIVLISIYFLASIKIYILLAFIPPALLWVFNENNKRIKNATIRAVTKPFAILLGVAFAYLSATGLTEGDEKYDVEKLGEQSKINSIYLTKQVVTGSAYDIGIFDGSLASLATVGPQAVVVALYRPFIWEVRNPIMLLSAIESSLFIYLTFIFFYKVGFFKSIKFIASKPILSFCLIFSIILAFGVGTNSGNFGTLVRYKIPIMPFYLAALYIMQSHLKRPKKVKRLAVTA
ncbi:hypothetical protein GU926_17120 [Nibribacter ruber]|uniref:Glycosyltransferase RgtA/B/C/D-like domain-containing protein n=1 Tax=Nibribacter ruber TaxID=2698458 RepID=A0A6P1P3M9_9BACT|nr:hypothetical protein [Nibribacter ruber]QHL89054.1 hypothetical protein GU926_17120 [Nibribacter ruber]